jgi:hypothetical protein
MLALPLELQSDRTSQDIAAGTIFTYYFFHVLRPYGTAVI